MQQISIHNRKLSALKKTGLLLILSFICLVSQAQTDWLSWNGVTVSAEFSNKWEASLGHSRVYNISNKFNNDFNQTQFSLTYNLTKRWSVQAGTQLTTSPASPDVKKRVFLRTALSTRLFNSLNWTNSIRGEYNSVEETRSRERVMFTTRLALRKRTKFLKLTPSVTYSIYYNIGGNSIKYYDKTSSLVAQQSPDGLHRSRLTFNLQSKINKFVSLSLYYMRQQEFNLLSSDTRKMNVYDPVRNRILRPFHNFNTLGATLQFNLSPLFKN